MGTGVSKHLARPLRLELESLSRGAAAHKGGGGLSFLALRRASKSESVKDIHHTSGAARQGSTTMNELDYYTKLRYQIIPAKAIWHMGASNRTRTSS